MIISASRRTDIPALYSKWFIRRMKEGYCLVKNPFFPAQIKRVSLLPQDITAIVFWTRYSKSMQPFLPELDRHGIAYYFLYTITGYGKQLEPFCPSIAKQIKDIQRLADMLGKNRVIWRYDPIILSKNFSISFHQQNFARLVSELKNSCKKIIISMVDYYTKSLRNLQTVNDNFMQNPPIPVIANLLEYFYITSLTAGLEMQTCAETRELFPAIPPGKCIDDALISNIINKEYKGKKHSGQRPACRCVQSIDIGAYNGCIHGCKYCYAVQNHDKARQNYLLFNQNAESL